MEKNKTKKAAVCPVAKKCGGCEFQGMPYAEQLKHKEKRVRILLDSFGKVHPIIGMKDPYHYRNKVHAVFDRDRRGNAISGVYQKGTHKVVPVDSCMIEDQKADEIIVTIRGLLKSFKIKTYDEDTQYGLLRHVLIRRGFSTGEIMVVLVTASPVFPSKTNFVKALRKVHPEITTVVQNINDRGTSMVLGTRDVVLYGKGFIEDKLCGCTFRISAQSFYQVNPVQTEKLYSTALEYAGLTGEESVWDLYCGIGTISLFLSQKAKQVYGVEIVPQAIEDAKNNAALNGITNAQFYVGKAEEVLPAFYNSNNLDAGMRHPDVIVVDPPRKGCDEQCLSTMLAMRPERIVYVSCDSATLARDLRILVDGGYELQKVRAFDQFAHTGHVETVVLLSKGIIDSQKVKVEMSLEDMDMSGFQ